MRNEEAVAFYGSVRAFFCFFVFFVFCFFEKSHFMVTSRPIRVLCMVVPEHHLLVVCDCG